MKTIYCFAGPNGSGKSSIFKNIIEANRINCKYINPDVIATTEPFSSIDDYTERNKRAGEYARELREKYVKEGESFAFETVLSHPSHLEFLQKAKEQGYNVVLIYVTTQDPSINVERVNIRVQQGGHNVEKNKIIDRYKRSSELLPKALEIADTGFVFDNTIKHTLSVVKMNSKTYTLSSQKGKPNPLTEKLFPNNDEFIEIPKEIIGDLSQQVSFGKVDHKLNTFHR